MVPQTVMHRSRAFPQHAGLTPRPSVKTGRPVNSARTETYSILSKKRYARCKRKHTFLQHRRCVSTCGRLGRVFDTVCPLQRRRRTVVHGSLALLLAVGAGYAADLEIDQLDQPNLVTCRRILAILLPHHGHYAQKDERRYCRCWRCRWCSRSATRAG